MRAILIDDEQHCTETLRLLLEQNCPDVEILEATNDSRDGVQYINALKPDLVFLDIEMPHLDGFDVLRSVDSRNFSVIFTTAYDEFAIRAIKQSALDYLLKPIDREELINALAKARQEKNDIQLRQFDNLLEHIDGQHNRKVALPTLTGLELVLISDIVRCEAANNYTTIFIEGQNKIIVSKHLKEVESMINSRHFIRPHQSHLVNVEKVRRYVRSDGGYLELLNSDSVPISRSKKDEVVEWLKHGL